MQKTKELKDYPEVLNAKMIATILNVGYTKALSTIKYGHMPYIKIGNVYRVSKIKFIEWLNSNNTNIVEI